LYCWIGRSGEVVVKIGDAPRMVGSPCHEAVNVENTLVFWRGNALGPTLIAPNRDSPVGCVIRDYHASRALT
jgi:hypothetical protein